MYGNTENGRQENDFVEVGCSINEDRHHVNDMDSENNFDEEQPHFDEEVNHLAEKKHDFNEEEHDFDEDINSAIETDIAFLYKKRPCRDQSTLLDYNCDEWIQQRPKLIIDHIRKLCNSSHSEKDNYLLARMVENIYNCRNKRFLLPVSFRENLVSFKLSKSNAVVSLNNASSPSGSPSTLNNWLNQASKNPLVVPQGTIRLIFDNEQVIGKRWRVKSGNSKVPMSAITSHVYLSIDKESRIQNAAEFRPSKWMFRTLDNRMIETIYNLFKENNAMFQITRNDFISERLRTLENHSIRDEILEAVDPYEHFRIQAVPNKLMTIHTGEPDMKNPNSHENIKFILRQLAGRANVDCLSTQSNESLEMRQWIYSENDVGIVSPILKLISKAYICPRCNFSAYGYDKFEKHSCMEEFGVNPQREFDWIVPQSGLLHWEINAGKAFMKLCWEPFMKEICFELGFCTDNAQKYAKNGSDHHKLWDNLEITYISFMDEILLRFIQHCRDTGIIVDISNYAEFVASAINPNFVFIHEMVFSYLHVLMMLRKGTRFSFINAAKNKLSLLFFGRNHPNYQFILSQEKKIDFLMPLKLKNIKFNSFVTSRKGNVGHYQSGDAILEEINKEAKRDIVGVPNEKNG